ncbi:MAG: hypothetical protein WBH44_09410 [Proteocatella sp.]
MKIKSNNRGSLFIDVIIGVNILIILGILTFKIIFFQINSLNIIETIDSMNSIANDEITKILRIRLYEDRSIEGNKVSYNKDYIDTVDGVDFYKLRMEIKNEKNKITRKYEVIIME